MDEKDLVRNKKTYRPPDFRIYGSFRHLTQTMWWGLYPDHLGRLDNDEPKKKKKS